MSPSCMGRRNAIDLFGEWARNGRDEGMEKGHFASVMEMFGIARTRLPTKFSAIDVGCGNGWAVRQLQNIAGCQVASGVDGSLDMIEKARKIHPVGDYKHGQLPTWIPDQQYDFVVSMEFMYYLEDPFSFIGTIYDKWLTANGCLAFGIDHYFENTESLSWPSSLGLKLATKSEKEWKGAMHRSGFIDVESFRVQRREGWEGTLVIVGTKN